MRFVLVEELKSLDAILTSKGAQNIQKYSDELISATTSGKLKKVDKSVGKMLKRAGKALDSLSKEDRAKIRNVRDIFEREASFGIGTERFKFLASLPDEAYQNRANFEYFVNQIDKKNIEVPKVGSTVTEESLEEALGDYIFPYNDKGGLFYNKSLWSMDIGDFESVLNAYNTINKRKYAEDTLGWTPERLQKNKMTLKDALNDAFVGKGNVVRSPSEVKEKLGITRKNYETEREESQKVTVDEYAKNNGYKNSAYLLSSLIKDYHDKLSDKERGSENEQYYSNALKNLWSNYIEMPRQKEGSMGKKKAEFLQELIKKVKYTDPNPNKLLSDFERAVDDRVEKGILNFSILTDSRGG